MFESTYAWLRGHFYRLFGNELIRRVVKNSGYLFSATGISAALSMLQSILVTNLLGPGGFGILGTITNFTTVINKLASFRMNELVIKYVGQYTEAGDRPRAAALFKSAAIAEMLASLVAFGLIWLLAPVGARFFAKDPGLANYFLLYGLIILANLIAESSTGLLQIFDRFRPIAILSVVQSILTLAIIFVAYLTHGGLMQVLLAYIAGKVIGAVGLTVLAILEASQHWGRNWWRTPISLLRPEAPEMVKFAFSTNISASLSLINKDSELLWVAFFTTPVQAGYYKLALSLANLVQLPINPLPQATYPELSREAARRNWANFRYVLRQGSLLAGGYTLAATLGLLIIGRPLIRIVYTPEFLPSYPGLLILLAGFLVANTFYWNRTALLALNRPDFPTKVNAVLAVLKVIGIILLVPTFGYLASAALLAGSYILGVSVAALKVRSLLSHQVQVEAV
jgi:O-antigen/teichoic acid export membrane protein